MAATGALLAGLALPAVPATALLPVQYEQRGSNIFCSGEGSVAGSVLEVGVFYNPGGELEGSFAFAEVGDRVYFANDAQGSYANGAWSVSLGLVTDAGTPAGSMVVEGTADPVGDLQYLDERFRDGNAWVTVVGTVQDLLVQGTVTAATGDVASFLGADLLCGGSEEDLLIGGTNPANRVYRYQGKYAGCALGDDGLLNVDVFGDVAFGFVAVGVDENTPPSLVADGELTVAESSISGDLTVYEPPTGETVSVDLTVGPIVDRGNLRFKTRNAAFSERYVDNLLTGTVSLPDGTTYEVDCTLRSFTATDRFNSQAGQKPGGRPPANDLPGGALAIDDGSTARTSTRGAAEAAEAPCVTEFGEVPIGRTVWYRFTGTGGDVTLSTVGSNFDTVIGVYEAGSLEQVACVDDTFETGLLAELTLSTDAGASYLVQIGGFAADWGKLVLSRS